MFQSRIINSTNINPAINLVVQTLLSFKPTFRSQHYAKYMSLIQVQHFYIIRDENNIFCTTSEYQIDSGSSSWLCCKV